MTSPVQLFRAIQRKPDGAIFRNVDLHTHTPASVCCNYKIPQEALLCLSKDDAALRADFATDFLAWLPPKELHDFENQLDAEDGNLKSFRTRVHACIESLLFPRDFVLRCMLEGLDVVAITDHNTPGFVEKGVLRSPTWYQLIAESAAYYSRRPRQAYDGILTLLESAKGDLVAMIRLAESYLGLLPFDTLGDLGKARGYGAEYTHRFTDAFPSTDRHELLAEIRLLEAAGGAETLARATELEGVYRREHGGAPTEKTFKSALDEAKESLRTHLETKRKLLRHLLERSRALSSPKQLNPLYLLPGVELTVSAIHILAIFSPDTYWPLTIAAVLGELGIPPKQWGNPMQAGGERSVQDTLEIVARHKGIAIPAHVNDSNGLFRLFPRGIPLRKIITHPLLITLEYVEEKRDGELRPRKLNQEQGFRHEFEKALAAKRGWVRTPLAFLKNSDAHECRLQYEGFGRPIGTRYSQIKLDYQRGPDAPHVIFRALGTSLRNGLHRVLEVPTLDRTYSLYDRKYIEPHERTPYRGMARTVIRGLAVKGGFGDGLSIPFNENINCIIGEPLSGSTSMLEFISFGLGLVDLAADSPAWWFPRRVVVYLELIEADGSSQSYALCRSYVSGDAEATGVVRLVSLSGDGVEREFALPRKGTKIDRYALEMLLREMTGASALRLPTYYSGDELYEAVYQKPKREALQPSAFAAIEHYRGLAGGVLRRHLSDEEQAVALEPILRLLESEEIYLARKGILLDPRLKRAKDGIRDYDKMRYGERGVALMLEILTSGFSRDELRETRLPEPLIIDQEDDLFEDVALYQQMLRGLLRRPRQIIWATVNPNIPIAWDADNILVCEREKDDRHMRIVASGAIDRQKVRSYTLDILEGGEQALRKRSTQYGI